MREKQLESSGGKPDLIWEFWKVNDTHQVKPGDQVKEASDGVGMLQAEGTAWIQEYTWLHGNSNMVTGTTFLCMEGTQFTTLIKLLPYHLKTILKVASREAFFKPYRQTELVHAGASLVCDITL